MGGFSSAFLQKNIRSPFLFCRSVSQPASLEAAPPMFLVPKFPRAVRQHGTSSPEHMSHPFGDDSTHGQECMKGLLLPQLRYVGKTRQASPAVVKWLESAGRDAWTFCKVEARDWVSYGSHERSGPQRAESPVTFEGRSTLITLYRCEGMRRNETVKLSPVNHQQLGREFWFLVWYLRNLEGVILDPIEKSQKTTTTKKTHPWNKQLLSEH